MFLNREEIEDLTGYKYKAKQKLWLMEAGYKFSTRCDGSPCVLRSHVEKILGGVIVANQVKQEAPNFAALKAVMNG